VGAGGEAADDDVAHVCFVERLHDALGLEAIVSAHCWRAPLANRSAARLASIVRRKR